MNKLAQYWDILNQSIYKGERLKNNLRALTHVSIVTAALGLILMALNIASRDWAMFAAAANTFVGGAACWYCASVLKNREVAAVIPTVFCAIVFTIYAVTGLGHGTAVMWSLLLPIGMCYFVSVKNGILLSLYHCILYFVLFISPVRELMTEHYTEAFMTRFFLLFVSIALFTSIAMVQYHRATLVEIAYSEQLNKEVADQTKVIRENAERLARLSEEMVHTLAIAIDAKDRYTNGHSFRVSWYAVALAQHLGWDESELQALGNEGLLHDIGKIGIPDAVLNKPGRLSDEEYRVIKSHTTIGGAILAQAEDLAEASLVARHHHERYDGRGYPDGLAGEQIPLHARVVAIADAYDAMRSDRIYRKGLRVDIIREELVKGRGTQFDPAFLDAFLGMLDTGELEDIAARKAFGLADVLPHELPHDE